MTDQATDHQPRHSIHRNEPNAPFKFIRRNLKLRLSTLEGAGEQGAAQADYEDSVADTG